MSFWERTLSGVRKMVVVEHRIDQLEKAVEKTNTTVHSQGERLAQVEFVIFGPIPPDRLRGPRG